MSASPFFLLFGFGPRRRKLVYAHGRLLDALTLEPLRDWSPVARETMDSAERTVRIESSRGDAFLFEDESGVHLEESGHPRVTLTAGDPVALPRFEGHPHAATLRRMHADILVNLMPFGPVPNLWVYPRPWYRDAALMLMVLRETGNLGLVRPWTLGIRRVFDGNNDGVHEADNLGELLFILSLFPEGREHQLIPQILEAAKSFTQPDGSLRGLSDYAEHPVYQTKWLKFGLRALGLDDSAFRIPKVPDSYSALFWMDFRDEHVPCPRFDARTGELYPYLAWAEAHFFGEPPPVAPETLPCSYESSASEAAYFRLAPLIESGVLPADHTAIATPHTWHAAEVFLHLIRR